MRQSLERSENPVEGPPDPTRRRFVRNALYGVGGILAFVSFGDFTGTTLRFSSAVEDEVDEALGTAVPSSDGEQSKIIYAFHQTVDNAAATAVASGQSDVTVSITDTVGLSEVFQKREDERLRQELREKVARENPFQINRIGLDMVGMIVGAGIVSATGLTEPRRVAPSPVK